MNIEKKIIAIPARLESKRLPNKLLEKINSKTIIELVIEQCLKVKGNHEIFLCTDSQLIKKIGNKLGVKVLITSKNCSSGTQRISSVLDQIITESWIINDYMDLEVKIKNEIMKKTLVINVQGDQPFLDPKFIDDLICQFNNKSEAVSVITPVYKLNAEDIHKPDVVKVIINNKKKIIYFSRSPIPYVRDQAFSEWHDYFDFYGHVGIYGFRANILSKWNLFANSKLEIAEKLEQLRLLDNGIEIDSFLVEGSPFSIDTQEQLDYARSL